MIYELFLCWIMGTLGKNIQNKSIHVHFNLHCMPHTVLTNHLLAFSLVAGSIPCGQLTGPFLKILKMTAIGILMNWLKSNSGGQTFYKQIYLLREFCVKKKERKKRNSHLLYHTAESSLQNESGCKDETTLRFGSKKLNVCFKDFLKLLFPFHDSISLLPY